VDDSLDGHQDEGLEDLFEDGEYLFRRRILVFVEVAHEVALLAVLHDDLQFVLVLVQLVVVDLDQVGVRELLHQLDFHQRLVDLEGVHVDLLQSE
jgi:hypothetical protein